MTIETYEIGATWNNDDGLKQIDSRLQDGWEVVNVSTYPYDGEVTERWTLRKGEKSESPMMQPQNVQVRAIKSIERTSTWSNSAQKHFDFWRCVLDNDEKVNVFDHPDESRNTFKLVKAQGWESIFTDTDEGIEYEPHAPIPVTVTFDGQWYSLVDIQVFGHYLQANGIYSEREVMPHYDDDFEPVEDDDSEVTELD